MINKQEFWFEFNIGGYCFIGFTLSELLNSLPLEYREICLTQLN